MSERQYGMTPDDKQAPRFWPITGILLAVVAVMVGVWFVTSSPWPGGMRPSRHVTDFDPQLTQIAQSALPHIESLKSHHDTHASFPESYDIPDWTYLSEDKLSTFRLHRKLGWDPSLEYVHDSRGGVWIYDPGDGSPTKEIQLKL